ncbi:MAG: LysM peptidoglycan-binding domain-containing M23 family metallopeptidase [Roseovarius sp.]|nr:LysM peptidoglycan-binding domain-containing M23 family metallopeptidase [Roseovarius sp.]
MRNSPPLAAIWATAALTALAGCGDNGLDFDLRGGIGNAPSTADAARNATASRPLPDARGVISYPSYQVAVARRGDTVSSLASRIGTDAAGLARYNGLEPGDKLRDGEIVALPRRVAEPAGGPLRPGSVDIASLAGSAIDAADSSGSGGVETSTLDPAPRQRQPEGVSGVEPVRHKVERGETAYSISRLYNVSVKSLADWNGLGSDFTVREGQYLLIPVALPGKPRSALDPARTTMPGEGSPTPEPPSAATPLPAAETKPAASPVETVAAPDLSDSTTAEARTRMGMPVRGNIVRDYEKGKNDGIDIAAAPGTPVVAAAAGTVAAITEDTNGVPIIVVKHPDNLLTVYSNIGNVTVAKGDSVARGGKLAEIRKDGTAAVHFEVRDGFDSVDPGPYLN